MSEPSLQELAGLVTERRLRIADLERQLAEARGLPTDGEICHSCGSAVALIWAARDEDWNKVVGGPSGLRCAKCFTEEAWEKHGISLAYIAVPLADGWRTDWYEAQGKLEAVERLVLEMGVSSSVAVQDFRDRLGCVLKEGNDGG